MNKTSLHSWQVIQKEVVRRINERVWQPGEILPRETDLALEFGCTRATVNRAMQEVANSGLINRRRKAGTRVTIHPNRIATLHIPVTRLEVEKRGATHKHKLLKRKVKQPPSAVSKIMGLNGDQLHLYLQTLHLSDDKPYLYEDRWVNINTVPDCLDIDFIDQSPNEWLVGQAPFTHGDIKFSASNASSENADILGISTGAAIFIVDRTTWTGELTVTTVRLSYAPGFQLCSNI